MGCFYLLNHFFTFSLFSVQIQSCSCALGGGPRFLAGAGLGARGLSQNRVSVSVGCWELERAGTTSTVCWGPSGDERNTRGEERLNHRSNKKIKEKQKFFRPVKVVCQNVKIGDWWALVSVCQIPCSFIFLCAATCTSFSTSVFAFCELLGPFVT